MFFEAHLHLEYSSTSELSCGYINSPAFVTYVSLLLSTRPLYLLAEQSEQFSMAGRKRAASPSGGASTAKKTKKNKR